MGQQRTSIHSARATLIALVLLVPLFGVPTASAASSPPVVLEIQLPTSVLPTPGGNTSVEVSVLVRDADGWEDIHSVTISVWTPAGALLVAPFAAVVAGAGAALEVTYVASFNMTFYAAPSLVASGYRVDAQALDAARKASPVVSDTFAYEPLAALSLPTTDLDFGALLPGNVTGLTELPVRNAGNVPIDVLVSGGALTQAGASIPASALSFGASPDPNATRALLTKNPQLLSQFNLQPGASETKSLYWVLTVPSASAGYVPAGVYVGQISVDAIEDDDYVRVAPCNDGLDNDGDGYIDFPNDSGCMHATDNKETPMAQPLCTGTDPVSRATPQDPGFAYEDVNNDGAFTEGTDVVVDSVAIGDGEYLIAPDRPGVGLVIPASVGALASATTAHFAAGAAASLFVGTDVAAPDGIVLEGGEVMVAPAVALRSTLGGVTVTAADDLIAQAAIVESSSDVTLSGGGVLYLAHGDFASTSGGIAIVGGSDLDLRAATVSDATGLFVNATGRALARAATISSGSIVHVLGADGVGARCASVVADSVEMTSGLDMEASGMNLSASPGAATLAVKRSLRLVDANLSADGGVLLHAGLDVSALRVRLDATANAIRLDAGGRADLRWAVVEGSFDHAWQTGGALDLREAQITIQLGRFDATAGDRLDMHRATIAVPGGASAIIAAAPLEAVGLALTVHDAVTLEGSSISLVSSSSTSNTKAATVRAAAGNVTLSGTTVVGPLGVFVTSPADVAASGATLRANDGLLQVTGSGPVNLGGSVLLSRAEMNVVGFGDIRLETGSFTSTKNHIRFDASTPSASVFVQDALFVDNNKKATIGPNGVTIVGTPATGGIN